MPYIWNLFPCNSKDIFWVEMRFIWVPTLKSSCFYVQNISHNWCTLLDAFATLFMGYFSGVDDDLGCNFDCCYRSDLGTLFECFSDIYLMFILAWRGRCHRWYFTMFIYQKNHHDFTKSVFFLEESCALHIKKIHSFRDGIRSVLFMRKSALEFLNVVHVFPFFLLSWWLALLLETQNV